MPSITIKNLPPSLHRALKQRAKEHGRSLNREILVCLRASVSVERIDVTKALASADRVRGSDAVRLDANLLARALDEGRP